MEKTLFGNAARAMDLPRMRERLRELGRDRDTRYWRSLGELNLLRRGQAGASAAAAEPDLPVDRRDFMKLMGGTMAVAGLTACTKQPEERIIPYVDAPEEIIPGRPLYYATALPFDGYAQGVRVESHMGRPTKVEGNPRHPASQGASDAYAQAAILDLYDPDRSQIFRKNGVASDWSTFTREFGAVYADMQTAGGEGLRILMAPGSSPTVTAQLLKLKETFPSAQVHYHEPVSRDNVRAGSQKAFGKVLDSVYDFSKADRVLSLDSDFLSWSPGKVRYAKDFADRRDASEGSEQLNRLYVIESAMTPTGASADHRLPAMAGRVQTLARALVSALGLGAEAASDLTEREQKFVKAVADDLAAHKGKSLVIAGEIQDAGVHALAHLLNEKLGNVGHTVSYIAQVQDVPENVGASFKQLCDDIIAHKVQALLVMDVNPAFSTPVDLRFRTALKQVPYSVHLGAYLDETGIRCTWHIPMATTLESWSDARAFDGSAGIVQPLISPLYGGRSLHDVLALLAGQSGTPAYDLVRTTWAEKCGLQGEAFEAWWRKVVHNGIIPDTMPAAEKVKVSPSVLSAPKHPPVPGKHEVELVFRPDPAIWDGRYSNNSWLQEMPNPVTTLTWENVLMLSPATARALHMEIGNDGVQARERVEPEVRVMRVTVGEQSIELPALVVPGHPDGSVTVTLGYGRNRAGRVGNGLGVNTYAIRSADALWQTRARVRRTNRRQQLAMTQDHHFLEGRNLLRVGTQAEHAKDPEFAKHMGHTFDDRYTMFNDKHGMFDYSKGLQWGMVIDLNRCTGCNACVVACQSENNIASVGKKEVLNGRELHWIRVDRYFSGDPETGDVQLHNQPLPCMQCENAPCEVVCPVGATSHSNDGLNQMVYNRCVGTRYCSNNCPYKVRRYNYFKYSDDKTESLKLGRNPDVTVRLRGVMEKCTYCVQRINTARIDSKVSGKPLTDGQIVTACQQSCPTQAITFGDINDPKSKVAKLKDNGLDYTLIEELNVRPRTSYLAKVRNPNPALEAPAAAAAGHGDPAHEKTHKPEGGGH